MLLILLLCFWKASSQLVCPTHNSFGNEISYDLTLGDTKLNWVEWSPVAPSKPGLRFLNLHQNENASVVATKAFLYSQGSGSVFYWRKKVASGLATRTLVFTMGSMTFQIDPNRMFTPAGIKKSLSPWTAKAGQAVYDFGKLILRIWDNKQNNSAIIAIHNNALSGGLSAKSYLPGQVYENEAANVSIGHGSPKQFFLFSNTPKGKAQYAQLSHQGFSVVLQSLPAPKGPLQDDGSLSYYAQTTDRDYVNVEATAPCSNDVEGIAILEQLNMIRALAAVSN